LENLVEDVILNNHKYSKAYSQHGVNLIGVDLIHTQLVKVDFYQVGIFGTSHNPNLNFISIIPAVVIACLTVSLLECLMLLPAHLSHLPNPDSLKKNPNPLTRKLEVVHHLTSFGMEWFVARIYTPFLSKALYWRYISLCIAISILLLTIGLIKGGILKFEVIPEVDGFVMTSTVEFPSGTPSEITGQAIARIEAALLRLAENAQTSSGESLLENRTALIGQTDLYRLLRE